MRPEGHTPDSGTFPAVRNDPSNLEAAVPQEDRLRRRLSDFVLVVEGFRRNFCPSEIEDRKRAIADTLTHLINERPKLLFDVDVAPGLHAADGTPI